MRKERHSFSKYLKSISSRHHYIPRFLISGFANAEDKLYIYDKKKDIILKNARPPKSIFFENNRNTIELDSNTKTSIIENLIYKEIDDKTSRIVKLYQESILKDINFDTEDTAIFLFFLISLFWRIPLTDYAADDLMNRSTITTDRIDPEFLRADPAYRKLSRAGLFKHHIDEIRKHGLKGGKWHNIYQSNDPIHYVIGDCPILFRNQTGLFSDFNDTDILVAISSNRIYSSTNQKIDNFPSTNSWQYNACILDQSVRYVACGNFKALEFSVLFYKKLKETGLMHILPEEVFKV